MKMKNIWALFLIVVIACDKPDEVVLQDPDVEAAATLYAIEQINDTDYNILETEIGSARFEQRGSVVTLTIELTGLTPNTSKAVHIHNGTVTTPGRHWNQQSFYAFCNERSLGSIWAKPFAGDVGNVVIDSEGNGTFTIDTDLWALNSGDEKDILDKVIIIHEDPEDFALECDPRHDHNHMHSNPKIGGGTIIMTSNLEQASQSIMTHYPDFTICR